MSCHGDTRNARSGRKRPDKGLQPFGTPFAPGPVTMFRTILFSSVLAFAAAVAEAPAQHVSIGIGRGGVQLRVGTHDYGYRGSRRHHVPPVVRSHQRGCWQTHRERVWVAGCERVVHVPARYAWRRDACGRMVRVCVRPAYDRVVREPGRWEWRERRVWVPYW